LRFDFSFTFDGGGCVDETDGCVLDSVDLSQGGFDFGGATGAVHAFDGENDATNG